MGAASVADASRLWPGSAAAGYLGDRATKGKAMAAKRLFSILGDSISTFEGCNPAGFRVFYEGERREATGVREARDTWWEMCIRDRPVRIWPSICGNWLKHDYADAVFSVMR